MSLNWVLDVSSRHEVSSKQHLLQIMNAGGLFTDTGAAPTDYLSSSYIQTADIDLDGETVIPIGTVENPFMGTYDGGNMKIYNWSFTGVLDNSGLFGYCSNATLRNLVLAGVWNIDTSGTSFSQHSGLLVGYNEGSSETERGYIYNISTEFETGTSYVAGQCSAGIIIGDVRYCTVQAVTLGGVFSTCRTAESIGCVISVAYNSTLFMLRNVATFETPITGKHLGGVGYAFRNCDSSYVMNAMTGDITGIILKGKCGGVVRFMEHSAPNFADVFVNSMRGNLTSRETASAITYAINTSSTNPGTFTRFINYMKGNVLTDAICPTPSFTNSIAAMNGSVQNVNHTSVQIDTSFGMTVTGTDNGSLTVLTDYTYNSDFDDLPYVPFVGTDLGGTTHKWEFPFPNVSGKAEYSAYSDIVITSGSAVHTPISVVFDIPGSNTTEYLSYFKTDTSEVYVDNSLTVLDSSASIVFDYTGTNQKFPEPIQMELYCILGDISWVPLPGASWYRLTYTKESGSEVQFVDMTTDSLVTLYGVLPGVQYEVHLYSDLDPTTPVRSVSGTSPDVSPTSISDVLERLGRDLTKIPTSSLQLIAGDLDSAMSTGDSVALRQGKASFVEQADTITPSESGVWLTAFSGSGGPGQSITVALPDAPSTVLAYNHVSDTVQFDSVEYGVGSYFVLSGYKVTVDEILRTN